MTEPLHGFPKELSLDILQPRLVVGDVAQAILRPDFIPEEVEPFDESWGITMFESNMR